MFLAILTFALQSLDCGKPMMRSAKFMVICSLTIVHLQFFFAHFLTVFIAGVSIMFCIFYGLCLFQLGLLNLPCEK